VDVDVVVVGAGFAGVTAAREVSALGLDVVVLEGRDRIGGRTWLDERLGSSIEMGGTWVHWSQPHVWAEIERYEQGIVKTGNSLALNTSWLVNGHRRSASGAAVDELMDTGMRAIFKESRKLFERPFADPSEYKIPEEVDARSVGDILFSLDIDEDSRVLIDGLLSATLSAHCNDGSLTQAMRWTAAAGHDWYSMVEASSVNKLANGTKGLLSAMAADVTGEIRLSTPVAAIERNGQVSTVITREGDRINARAVIVTAPRNALRSIDFRPGLSDAKRAVIDEGPAGMGVKVWARVAGDLIGWLGTPAPSTRSPTAGAMGASAMTAYLSASAPTPGSST
jgi:monoamine oxidase